MTTVAESVPSLFTQSGIKVVRYFDDFVNTVTYTSTDDTATGTNAYLDGAGGWYNVVTAAADNDHHLMSTASEAFLFAADKPLYFEAKVKLTEANTDDANIVIGLSDTLTDGLIADDGAGMPASYDGACFYKVDGGTVWQFETSNATTQVTNTSLATFTSGSEYILGLYFNPNDGTTGKITPYINGTPGDTHDITLSGLAEMQLVFGVKAGGANAETLSIDYIGCEQTR